MDVLVLKIILLVFMGIVPLVFGLMPIKLYKILTKTKGRLGKNATTTISMLSCFCGGIIIGVCLIDLLPEARDNFESAKEGLGWKTDYPYVEFFAGIGFYIVYFVEEFLNHMCGLKHDHGDEGAEEIFAPIGESDCSSTEDVKGDYPENGIKEIPDPVKHHPDAQERRKAVTSAIAFVLALLFHTSLEGFAFGVQKTVVSMSSLFFGVITHKALVAFSVGINFAKSLKHNQTLAVFLIILVASFSPIGGVIGIVVQNTPMDEMIKAVVSCILTCFSIGTFLYIAFFEILAPEQGNGQPPLLQWMACTLGYFAMAGFLAFSHQEHS